MYYIKVSYCRTGYLDWEAKLKQKVSLALDWPKYTYLANAHLELKVFLAIKRLKKQKTVDTNF